MLLHRRLTAKNEVIYARQNEKCINHPLLSEKDGSYLMLHRITKKNDINKDKWIGVGGHFEEGESPEECLCREVCEETGY